MQIPAFRIRMTFFHLLSVALVGFSIPMTRSQESCPQAWIYLEGFCYKFSSQSLTWYAARTACENMGSMLAVVDATKLKGQKHWIGLYRDPEDTSRWLWTDWSRLCTGCGYWSNGEPNNYKGRFEGCGEMWPSKSGLWNDENCSTKRRYICQKKACSTFGQSEDEPL